MFFAPVLAVVLSSRAQVPDQGLILRYKFHAGQKLKYSMKTTMGMDMTIQGQDPHKMGLDSEIEQNQAIASVAPDGTATIDTKSVPLHMSQNGQEVTEGEATKPRTGKITMSPLGTVSNVKIEGAENVPGVDFNSMSVNGQVPEAAVKVGSAWDSSFDMAGMGKTKVHCTITKIETVGGDVLATIHAEGTFDVGQLITSMGSTSGLSGSGDSKFIFDSIFDATTGMIKSTVMEATYNIDMKPNDGSKPPLKMKGDQKVTMTLVSAS